MHEMALHDTSETRRVLYETILSSTLIFQGKISGGRLAGDGGVVADGNTRVAFGTIEHPPGHVILPAFSDIDALISFAGPSGQWVALPAKNLFQAIVPGDIAEVRINPFRTDQKISRPGGIVTRGEFAALAQGLLPESMLSGNVRQMAVGAGQKLIIGRVTKEPPAEVLKKISDYLRAAADVKAAYLFQMSGQGVTSVVVGMEFETEPGRPGMELLMKRIGEVVMGTIPKDQAIDFMPLKAGAMLEGVRKNGRRLL